MCGRMAWGIPVLFLTGIGGSLLAADATQNRDPGLAAFQKWHAGHPPVAAPKPKKPVPSKADEARAAETAEARKAQEEANLMRRLAVCDKLKQVAMNTGDEKLERQVDDLEEKATEVFQQRTTKPTPKSTRGNKP